MIELLLRVARGGGSRDVTVEFAEGQRIAEVVDALAQHLGASTAASTGLRLRCARLGPVLDREQTVVGSGLVSGDEVELVAADILRSDSGGVRDGLYCDVISGPRSGTSTRLTTGAIIIGRAADTDLRLEDPTVSKRHAELVVTVDGELMVAPLPDVTNPVIVNGTPITGPVTLDLGAVLELGACALVVRHYTPEEGAARDQLGQIPFNRTPYRHPDLSAVEVPGPGRPPTPPEPRPLMVLAMLAPAIAGAAFALILQRPLFLLFALLSPITMLANWYSERRRGGNRYQEQLATFERRMEAWLTRYDEALSEERHRRTAAAPDVGELARRAELRTPELWSRSRNHPGFLQLRVGLGDLPATTTTSVPDDVEADPDGRIEAAVAQRRLLRSVPVMVDLPERGAIAFHGDADEVAGAVAALINQAAVLHSPDDLVLCAGLAEGSPALDWLKWLPHTRSVASPLSGAHLAVGAQQVDDLLNRLLEVTTSREELRAPRVLLVLEEGAEADSLLVAAVLESGPAVGVHAVWVGRSRAMVPRQATVIVEHPPVRSGAFARLWSTVPEEPVIHLTPDRLDLAAAPRIARALTPVRDASLASAAASIPRVAPLLETLGGPGLDGRAIAERWRRPRRYGLPTPIGIGSSGTFEVDLVEHGPHALIAGTSGAGKSELLQSLIAGLITYHPPTHVNLLFIDYKGGAASNTFQPAPHTVGYVTNLSADLAMRALVSLRAELDRRMRLLEDRAKDLEEMLERHPEDAPPSLVIVVDEFATLVKEIPDFVTGMVDIAQRGRSLGIHLILATQRPSGSVNDDILANTNLRISLRVLDASDSTSILGGPDAAAIPAPLRGRGFARLGGGSLVEFQSAFAGAPVTTSSGSSPVMVTDLPPTGRTTVLPEPEPHDDSEVPTHLDVVLDAVTEATRALGVERGRRPWLEDLPHLLPLAAVFDGAYGPLPPRSPGRDLVLGVVDLPAEQAQRPAVIDVEATGGVTVFGTGGSGRTTTLRTLLASAVVDGTPREVEIYALDFAGRGLEPLRDLPHVAAVAAGDDLEQTTRIIMHLRAEVERRQALLAEHRAEHLTALQELQPQLHLPRLLLAVDGYEAFERTFERGDLYTWSAMLIETVLAGRGAGLHLMATADRRVSVPAALGTAIGARVLLRTADVDGLTDLGVPIDVARSAQLGDGRALLSGGELVQIAVVGEEVGGKAQTAAIEQLSQRSADGMETRLAELPGDLTVGELPGTGRPPPLRFRLGIADLTSQPVWCDIRLQPLSVFGPAESGRSTALLRAATDLLASGAQLWVLAGPGSPLAQLELPPARIARTRDEQAPLLAALTTALEERTDGQPHVVVIDGAEQVDDGCGFTLEAVLDRAGVHALASFDASTATSFSRPSWHASFKNSRRILLLQPDELGDLSVFTPQRIRLRPQQRFPAGRGVFISGRSWQLVQIARAENRVWSGD